GDRSRSRPERGTLDGCKALCGESEVALVVIGAGGLSVGRAERYLVLIHSNLQRVVVSIDVELEAEHCVRVAEGQIADGDTSGWIHGIGTPRNLKGAEVLDVVKRDGPSHGAIRIEAKSASVVGQ